MPCSINLFVVLLLLSQPSAALARLRVQTAPQRADSRSGVQSAAPVSLELGKPIERELAGGEAHAYTLKLDAGQYLLAVFEQRGVDVVVLVFSPEGKPLAEVDSPNGMQGPEPISLLADSSGVHRFEVRALEKGAPAGKYEVRIEALRAATPQDRARVAALRTSAEGTRLLEERTESSARSAIEKYEEAIPLLRAAGDLSQEAVLLNRVGTIYDNLGEKQQALDHYELARALWHKLGDFGSEARALNNMATVQDELGDNQRALESYKQALSLARAVGDRNSEAQSLHNLGSVTGELGDEKGGLEYLTQSLMLRRAAQDRRGEAWVLDSIAEISQKAGDYRQALDYYNQSLAIMEEIGAHYLTPGTIARIGMIYSLLGDKTKALEFYNKSLGILRATGHRVGEAGVLLEIARVERDRGSLGEARKQAEAALVIVESLRGKLMNLSLRTSYFSTAQPYYEFYIDLLQQSHKQRAGEGLEAEALRASERARARALLELLAEARADIRQGVDAELLRREGELRKQLDELSQPKPQMSEDATELRREIDALTNEYHKAQAEIRLKSPRYAALAQPVPLGLKEIQALLDTDTLLLEYALGDERSYLWAVSQSDVKSFELPGRAEVESAAHEVYDSLTARVRGGSGRELRGQQARGAGTTNYAESATRLSRMTLAPVASLLGKKRLVVVGDGVLQYIPFAALPDPAASPARPEAQPLVVNHEIVSLPSASVLAVLRRDFSARPPAPKTVAVLADPVFDASDERMVGAATSNGDTRRGVAEASAVKDKVHEGIASSRYALERAFNIQPSGDAGRAPSVGPLIPRLPFTRREAAAITGASPVGAALSALDFDASRETATGDKLSQYRVVHFATHGILNAEHPELSGIVLSLVDRQGRPQDGFLRLHEIYNLKLGAELVVLSACQTALGKDVRGEGLVGLTRGFMYAGSPRVMASLWKVDDVATSELMKIFYQKILRERRAPAAALREAQIEMWKKRRWNEPYYWAAFQLQGEWK